MGPVAPPAAIAAAGPVRPEDSLNVRDAISAFIGKGYINTKDADARALFSYLRGQLGPEAAQKMILHLSMYNQRPDMRGVSPSQRVQSFYEIGSRDPEINNIIGRAKQVAQGPMAGLNEAPTQLNRDIMGQQWYTPGAPVSAAGMNLLRGKANLIR